MLHFLQTQENCANQMISNVTIWELGEVLENNTFYQV